MRPEPVRGDNRQAIEGMAHGFAHIFQAMEFTNRRQYMGRIGTLFAARLEQAGIAKQLEQRIEQQRLGIISQQPATKLTQDREIEAGVVEG